MYIRIHVHTHIMVFSLEKVFCDEDTFHTIVRLFHDEILGMKDVRVSFSVLIDDGKVEDQKPKKRKVKNNEEQTFDYPTLMGLVHTEHPTPDYNSKEYLVGYITKTLEWMLETPQLLTNRVLMMLMFMYVSEKLRDEIRAGTPSAVGKIYFEGSVSLRFKVSSFEDRMERILMGVMASDNQTAVISALTPPFCVYDELMLYEAITRCEDTGKYGG